MSIPCELDTDGNPTDHDAQETSRAEEVADRQEQLCVAATCLGERQPAYEGKKKADTCRRSTTAVERNAGRFEFAVAQAGIGICGPTTETSGIGAIAHCGAAVPEASAASRAQRRSKPAGVQMSR